MVNFNYYNFKLWPGRGVLYHRAFKAQAVDLHVPQWSTDTTELGSPAQLDCRTTKDNRPFYLLI